MPLPTAHIAHQAEERLRIKIPSRKGEASYFIAVIDKFAHDPRFKGRTESNALTGSLLFSGQGADPAAVGEYATRHGLFALKERDDRPVTLSKRIVAPLEEASRSIQRFTGGEVDLAGMAFVSLLVVGIYEIARGNFRSPPWYTAFWYALGVFSKSLMDKNAPP